MNPRHIATAGGALLFTATVVTAASLLSRVDATPEYVMLTEGDLRGVRRVPLRAVAHEARVGTRDMAIFELQQEVLPSGSGVAGGMSGSPIVHRRDGMIGVHVAQLYFRGSRLSGASRWDSHPWRTEGARWIEQLAGWSELVASGGFALTPGSSIRAAWVWGDLDIGYSGTVSAIDGTRCLTFGHRINGQGRCEYALFRAPVASTVESIDRMQPVTLTGELVGGVYLDRNDGLWGAIGRLPPLVLIRFSVSTSVLSVERAYWATSYGLAAELERAILEDVVASTGSSPDMAVVGLVNLTRGHIHRRMAVSSGSFRDLVSLAAQEAKGASSSDGPRDMYLGITARFNEGR